MTLPACPGFDIVRDLAWLGTNTLLAPIGQCTCCGWPYILSAYGEGKGPGGWLFAGSYTQVPENKTYLISRSNKVHEVAVNSLSTHTPAQNQFSRVSF